MPIEDINGNPLQHYRDFPNDEIVNNIEFGGGKGYFGKREFPNCYITDLKRPEEIQHFSIYEDDYENQNCHYLDAEVDYFNSEIDGRTFDNLIFCNPSGFGFLGLAHAQEFLNRAGELLNENGRIHILGHTSNPWSKSKKVLKYLEKLTEGGELNFVMSIAEKIELDEHHEFIQNHVYTWCDTKTVTKPNERIIIQKLAS